MKLFLNLYKSTQFQPVAMSTNEVIGFCPYQQDMKKMLGTWIIDRQSCTKLIIYILLYIPGFDKVPYVNELPLYVLPYLWLTRPENLPKSASQRISSTSFFHIKQPLQKCRKTLLLGCYDPEFWREVFSAEFYRHIYLST